MEAGRIISTPAQSPSKKCKGPPPSAAATCAALSALRYVPLNECLVHGHALRMLVAYTAALYLRDCRIKPSKRGRPLPTWRRAEGEVQRREEDNSVGQSN